MELNKKIRLIREYAKRGKKELMELSMIYTIAETDPDLGARHIDRLADSLDEDAAAEKGG